MCASSSGPRLLQSPSHVHTIPAAVPRAAPPLSHPHTPSPATACERWLTNTGSRARIASLRRRVIAAARPSRADPVPCATCRSRWPPRRAAERCRGWGELFARAMQRVHAVAAPLCRPRQQAERERQIPSRKAAALPQRLITRALPAPRSSIHLAKNAGVE